ncbi:acyl-CoA dehydrogenase family protein [Cumulibacter manganitolerans]|uniref:acyl-CoA dehydrogenase family protein n=1 Tax=Cumulibacter manganitolerans TaxID=1884992 RepID=UPI00129635DB|nr:acyl-CoA dehydrogenase family protein [Cumulibacter manganitolerans]
MTTTANETVLGSQYALIDLDEENELASTLRGLLTKRAAWQDVLARTEAEDKTDRALWTQLASELGLAGLAVPEELGGAGASWREVGVVMTELGRATAPVPYLGSAVLATAALLHSGETHLLGQIASGEKIATLAVPFTASPTAPFTPTVTVSEGRLTGRIPVVADALAADVLVVPAADGLYAVAASEATIAASVSLDMTRPLADITLDGAQGTSLGGDPAGAVREALTIGAAMLACEMLGVAQNALDTAIAYMKQRYQFGRLIASYQALKHRMADVYVGVSQLQAAAKYAAACAGGGDADLPIAAAVAKAHASVSAVHAAQECLQMHGGQGMTWENPSHLMVKRAKADSLALGRADAHRTWLGELINLPA